MLATARAADCAEAPLFYHQRGVFDPHRPKFQALKKALYLSMIEKPILRKVTTLIGLTEAEPESYAALDLTTSCRVTPNGLTLLSAASVEHNDFMLREQGIEPQHQVVMFMGRLHPIKGAD